MVPHLQPFSALQLIVLPDDDEVFDGVPVGCAVTNGTRVYIPASIWPYLEAELEQMPRMQ